MMDRDLDKAAETIFAAAIQRGAAAERAAYVDRACAGDEELRAWVGALLAAHDGAGDGFMAGPPADLAATAAAVGADDPPGTRADAADEAPGTAIGRYTLVEQIGAGGMGVVFLAEQTRPVRRQVALKVIRAGMDTRQVVARFEAERQALAVMDHPNIAKVLDGGSTAGGRPYFVMELVRGVPITDYCDANRLAPRERLGLFAQSAGPSSTRTRRGSSTAT
jgi:hypothetical protein